ncbi:MAG: sialate O-acetylesterase [Kiritimatiellia bacterium]
MEEIWGLHILSLLTPTRNKQTLSMIRIISGLADGQVLQRLGSRGANLALTLSSSESTPLFATISDSKGRAMKGWSKRRIGALTEGRQQTIMLKRIPPGGPYRLTLAAGKSGVSVKQFFVGDVWLLAGQSNMEGCGTMTGAAKTHPLVRAFSMRREWRLAKDPLHICPESPDACHNQGKQLTPPEAGDRRRQNPKGVGPGIFFAREMLAKSGVPQGLICTAHGGTSMAQWDPKRKTLGGESLYASMLMSLQATGQPVSGILWYQGESDANDAAVNLYTERMKELVAATRRDFKQPSLPWIVVQIGRFFGDATSPPRAWNSIQEQQRLLPRSIRNLDVVAAIDLALDDLIHVGSAAFPTLAGRMAGVADRLVYKNSRALPAPQPGRILAGSVNITVHFSGVQGGLRAAGEPHGFALIDESGNVVPNIFKTTLEGDKAVLHLIQPPLPGTRTPRLSYGHGLTPVCNITDKRGQAVPVFGPLPIRSEIAWLPFIITWNVSPVVTSPAHKLAELGERDLDFTNSVARTYPEAGFVDEHERWQNRSGHCYFSSSGNLPEAMDLDVLMGYDGPFRLWVDGKPFFTDLSGINPSIPDESEKRIKLAKGPHSFRVAMDLNDGLAWGFFLRFKRRDVTRAQLVSGDFAKPVYSV